MYFNELNYKAEHKANLSEVVEICAQLLKEKNLSKILVFSEENYLKIIHSGFKVDFTYILNSDGEWSYFFNAWKPLSKYKSNKTGANVTNTFMMSSDSVEFSKTVLKGLYTILQDYQNTSLAYDFANKKSLQCGKTQKGLKVAH